MTDTYTVAHSLIAVAMNDERFYFDAVRPCISEIIKTHAPNLGGAWVNVALQAISAFGDQIADKTTTLVTTTASMFSDYYAAEIAELEDW